MGGIDEEFQIAAPVLVETVAIAAPDQAGKGGNLAQRFLQVVGGDRGELVELAVGAFQKQVGFAQGRHIGQRGIAAQRLPLAVAFQEG